MVNAKKTYSLDTNIRRNALVVTGEMEKVMLMDISNAIIKGMHGTKY